MPVSPVTDDMDLPAFSIQSNGNNIPDEYAVVSVRISQQLNCADIAEIVLLDSDPVDSDFKISGSATFAPGAEISINLGYATKLAPVFKGVVTSQVLSFNQKEGPALKIICKKTAVIKNESEPQCVLSVTYGIDIIDAEIKLAGDNRADNKTKFRGFIRFAGTALATVNSLIQVSGFGSRFSKDLYISAVEHLLADGNWVTKVELGIDPQ